MTLRFPYLKENFLELVFTIQLLKLYCIVSSVTNNIAYCNVINGGWKFALQMQDFKIIISEGYTEELMILVRNVPNFGEDYNLAIYKMNRFLTQAHQLP